MFSVLPRPGTRRSATVRASSVARHAFPSISPSCLVTVHAVAAVQPWRHQDVVIRSRYTCLVGLLLLTALGFGAGRVQKWIRLYVLAVVIVVATVDFRFGFCAAESYTPTCSLSPLSRQCRLTFSRVLDLASSLGCTDNREWVVNNVQCF